MYARVQLTVDTRANALTVPRNSVVDLDGKTGVFVAATAAGRNGRWRTDAAVGRCHGGEVHSRPDSAFMTATT